MSGLQRGDDTLQLTHETESDKGLGVGCGDVARTLVILPGTQFRADTGVVKTSGDRVGVLNLAMLVLEDVGPYTVEHTLGATG